MFAPRTLGIIGRIDRDGQCLKGFNAQERLQSQLRLLQWRRRKHNAAFFPAGRSTPSLVRTPYSSITSTPLSQSALLRYGLPSSLPSRRCYHPDTDTVPARELQFGQPVHETHPHLLQPGELTPGITAQEYHVRRASLASSLPSNSIAILSAAQLKYKSGSVFYEYCQDRDFLWLTGWGEEESVVVITKEGDGADYKLYMFVRAKDRKAELWDGARSGVDAAREVWNADEAYDISALSSRLPELISPATEIYTDIKTSPTPTNPLSRLFSSSSSKPSNTSLAKALSKATLKPLRPLLNTLRVTKSPAEIENMRHASKASGRAFTDAMRKSFSYERDLDAFLEYRFRHHGCDAVAFEPVVAGGKNGLAIHYVRNDDILRPGQMVLVDGGGEYGGYIADITRTWPISGRFSAAQRDLYQAVLDVQQDCISLCRETAQISLDALHAHAETQLSSNLKSIGFDMGNGAIEVLFPHHLSHYIGLDVHDCPGYSRKGELKAGMCVTVEPGVYVPDDERWPAAFRGVGIRIEDSVAVGVQQAEVLTEEAVKEVHDIEALRG